MTRGTDDGLPPDYDVRVERLCSEAVAQFRSCSGDLVRQLRACCDYFQRGQKEGISHPELIDFLGVSSPSILDRAGYSEEELLRVMDALRLITYDGHGQPCLPAFIQNSS